MMPGSNPIEIPQAPSSDELDQLMKWRRKFHNYPEIRWTEFWTSARIIDILEGFGFEVLYGQPLYQVIDEEDVDPLPLRKIVPDTEVMEEAYQQALARLGTERIIGSMKGGLTGVVARITGKKQKEDGDSSSSSQKLGFRVDIDGLPLIESSDHDHIPALEKFSATNGNMHACGHDGHIAIGLGLAKRISDHIDDLNGEFWIIFQPGEEGGMGGHVFSHLPFLKDLDSFMAVHLGLIGGRKLSLGLSFMDAHANSVEFRGRSTHSAVAPNEGKNALLAACSAVKSLYAIPRHGGGASRVNVGEFHSDNAMNIISDKTTFTYQTRGESPEVAEHMDREARRILQGAAQMYDVKVVIREEGHYISAPNDHELKMKLQSVARYLGIRDVAMIEEFKLPGSEDAPYLMQAVQSGGGKALFLGLGCDTRGGHHNSSFEFDEDLLLWGVNLLYGMIR